MEILEKKEEIYEIHISDKNDKEEAKPPKTENNSSRLR